jgi:hypothetical protein
MNDLIVSARIELLRRTSEPACVEASGQYIRQHHLDFANVEAAAGFLAVLPLRIEQAWFDFADEGELGVVIEAFGEDGETVDDLAAWPVAAPDRLYSMFGRVPVLGAANISNPATYFLGRPLQVHRTALSWLKAGGTGCVVVNEPAAARMLIDVPGNYAGEDRKHAVDLRRMGERLLDPKRILYPARRVA